MSFSPNINVWTLGKGARGAWKLHHTTDSLDEAAAWFARLEQQGKQVALYELGLFEHEGQQIAGQVGFWWSANLNDAMEREPEGRGVGWSDGYDTWVEYTYPEAASADEVLVEEEGWDDAPGRPRSAETSPVAVRKSWDPYERRQRPANAPINYFLLPGQILMWWDYMFPAKGRVLATARQRGNPIVEVIYAVIAWVIIILTVLIFGGIILSR